MHSLKPSGDNIAQEFLRLVGQKSLVKSASADEKELDSVHAELSETFDAAEDLSAVEFGEDLDDVPVAAAAEDAEEDAAEDPDFTLDSFVQDADLIDMITDESDGPMFSATEGIDEALDDFGATASERKVLVGLSKIAGSLRTKGEAFAADVVEATALSIKGDLRKDAGRRAAVVSGLKKLASEFYNSEDTLAGDMVQVTINKLGGFDDMWGKNVGDDGKLNRSKFAKAPADKKERKSVAIAHINKVAKMATGKKKVELYQDHGITGNIGVKYAVEFQDKSSVTVMQGEL